MLKVGVEGGFVQKLINNTPSNLHCSVFVDKGIILKVNPLPIQENAIIVENIGEDFLITKTLIW